MTSPLISYELAFSLTSKSSGDRISLLAERGSGDFIPLCRTCASHTVTASRSTGASRVRCRRSGKSPHTILYRSRVESFRGETMDEGASRRGSAPHVEQQKSEAESRFVVVIANVYKFQLKARNDTGALPKDLNPENDDLQKLSHRGTKCLSLPTCKAMVYKHRLRSNLSQFV